MRYTDIDNKDFKEALDQAIDRADRESQRREYLREVKFAIDFDKDEIEEEGGNKYE